MAKNSFGELNHTKIAFSLISYPELTLVNLVVRAVDVEDAHGDFLLVIFDEAQQGEKTALPGTDREQPQPSRVLSRDDATEAIISRLEEDLRRTRENLRTTIEQHEISIEELKASNEELQAINEELRSATEELETSKEELQSVNEELVTVNTELKEKIDETTRTNSDLQNLMSATDIATIFLDRNLRIKRYTPPVEDFFNITRADIGRPLEHFTHKLNYDDLARDAAQVLRKLVTIEHEITDKNNRNYLARFVPYRTTDDRIEGVVLNFIDITERARAEAALRESEERLRSIANLVPDLLWDSESDGSTNWYNRRWLEYTGQSVEEAAGWGWTDAIHPDDREASARRYRAVFDNGELLRQEHRICRYDGEYRWFVVNAFPLKDESGKVIKVYGAATDTHESRLMNESLRQSEEKYRTLFDSMDEGVSTLEIIFDENGRAVDFVYLENNQALTRLTGLTADINGKRVSEVIPDLEAFWLEMYERVVRTGTPERVEHFIAALGSWFDVFVARVGGADSRRIVVLYNNITERKLREQRQEFLLKFSDALRAEANADAVANRALLMLSEELGLDRCYIGVYRLEDDRGDFTHQTGNERVPPLPAQVRLSDFPEALRVAFDRTLVIENIAETKGLSDIDRQNLAALNLRALIAATLRKDENKPLWAIVAVSASPRRWTQGEIALIEAAAERTWAAVERARAEADLRESEEKARALIENLPGGAAFIVDRELRYQLAQGEALAAGFKSEDFTGRTMYEVLSPDLIKDYEPLFQKALAGESFDYEHESHGRTFISRGLPLRGANGEVTSVLALSYDITERKRAEERLRESEENLRLLIESVKDYAIFTIDEKRRVKLWNSGAEKIFGWTESEIVGKSCDVIFTQEDRDNGVPEQEVKTAAAKGRAADERWHVRKDNSLFFVNGVMMPLKDNGTGGYVKIARDLTEQMFAAEVLRASEESLKLATEAAALGSWDWDFRTNEMVWTTQLFDIFGLEPTPDMKIDFETVKPLIHPEDLPLLIETSRRARQKHESFKMEYRIKRADTGEEHWVLAHESFFYDEKNQPVRGVGIAQDITDRKEAEQVLVRSREELEMAVQERTAELEEANVALQKEIKVRVQAEQDRVNLLQQIVHTQEDERKRIARDMHDQLGQQLIALRLKLDLLKAQCDGNEELCVSVEDAEKVARRIDSDVDFLARELRPIALDDLGLKVALDNYMSEWSRHFGIFAELHAEGLPDERFSAETEINLYRIVQEALNNVAKHSGADKVDVLIEARDHTIILIIEDNGRGFDESAINLRREKGLGLLGMRERAVLLGGTLEIETGEGRGTTIFVRVPLNFGKK